MRATMTLAVLLLIPLATAQMEPTYQNPGDPSMMEGMGFCDGGIQVDSQSDDSLSYAVCQAQSNGDGGSFEMVQMFVGLGGSARLHMEGMAARGAPGGGSFTAFEYDLDLLQVVEFVDDGDGAYVPGEDEALATYSLTGGWGDLRVSEDGGVRFQADHPIGDGTFTLVGKATGGGYAAGPISVKPLDTKIDFMFSDYTYGHPESRLALVLHVASEDFGAQGGGFQNGGQVVQGAEDGVVGQAGSTHLYFTWADEAMVDGAATPVHSYVDILRADGTSQSGGNAQGGTMTANQAEAGITLAYARGDDIVHDPRLGAQFNVKKDSPGLPTLAGLAVIATLAAMRRR